MPGRTCKGNMNKSFDILIVRYCPYPGHAAVCDRTIAYLADCGHRVLTHDNTEKNIGLPAARNLLALQSGADVFVFADFDVEFGAVYFQAMADKAAGPDVGAVLPVNSNRIRRGPDWEPVKKTLCNCIAIKSDLFFQLGGFNEAYFVAFADWDLLSRLEERNLRILQHNRSRITRHLGLSSDHDDKKAIWAKDRAVYEQRWGDRGWS